MKKLMMIALGVMLPLQVFALEVGDFAPCVVLEGVDASGAATEGCIRDKTQAGQQFTVIEFFSIHCSTCMENLPRISKLVPELASNATVRLVSVDRRKQDVLDFLRDSKNSSLINFPVAFDVDRDAKRAYGVDSTPTLFILDKDYNIVLKHSGFLDDASLDEIRETVGVRSADLESDTLQVGDVAPCVVLEGLDAQGNSTEGCIRDHDSNQKFTLVEFFSIHCSTCAKNLPIVSRLVPEIASTTTVRRVSVDRSAQAVRDYLVAQKSLINFPVAFDTDRDAKRAYGVQQTPTSFLLDENNVVRWVHTGELNPFDVDELKELVQ